MCGFVFYDALLPPFPTYPNSSSWCLFDDDYDRIIKSTDTFIVRLLPPGESDPSNEKMIFKLANEVNSDAAASYAGEFTVGTKRRTG